jgi:hypothetical protein
MYVTNNKQTGAIILITIIMPGGGRGTVKETIKLKLTSTKNYVNNPV